MPLRITRTRLMRQRAIATPPPICRSKGITAFFLQTCTCPEPGTCTSVDIQGLTFPEAQAMLPGPPGTYGTWRYIDKEHHVDQSGTWNSCTPTGLGHAVAQFYRCDDGTPAQTGNISHATYADCLGSFHEFFPGRYWVGTWTSDDTGTVYPLNGSNCGP